LVGPDRPHQLVHRRAVGEVAEDELDLVEDVVDSRRVERTRAAHHPVDLVVLLEQQFGEVRPVLPGDAGDERLPPAHQRTLGGGGVPWASCHDTTGLRRTPTRSISASITSPGLRYQAAGSSLKPATPETVPSDRTSPALKPSGE